jgi:hypothetical protein
MQQKSKEEFLKLEEGSIITITSKRDRQYFKAEK